MPPQSDDTSQEKTLEPSPQKIERAKEQGNFARSKDLTILLTLLMVLLFFWLAQEYLVRRVSHTVAFFLRFDPFLDLSPATTPEIFWFVLLHLLPLLLPLFLLVFVTAVGAEVAQVGVRVVKDPFEVKWEKLDPVAGMKKLFTVKNVNEGAKSFLKFLIFAVLVYQTLLDSLPQIMRMGDNTPGQGLQIMFEMGIRLGFRTCMVLAFLAGFDYWFQRYQYFKGLRMSHQERKEEMKQTEGDPMIKGRIRSLQMEIARKRMMRDVPEADFILTNPTHYAVAIKYDPDKSPAPLVVAKGQNYLARKIREIALAEGVPLIENPPLAREIYRKTKIGQAIPADLFKAVAQIMASIYILAGKRGAGWAKKSPAPQPQPQYQPLPAGP